MTAKVQTNAEMPADNVLRYRNSITGLVCIPTHLTEAPYGWGEPYYDAQGNPINGDLGTVSDASLSNSPYNMVLIDKNGGKTFRRKTRHEDVPETLDTAQAYGTTGAWKGENTKAVSWGRETTLEASTYTHTQKVFVAGRCRFLLRQTSSDQMYYVIKGACWVGGALVVITQHNNTSNIKIYAGMVGSGKNINPSDYLIKSHTSSRNATDNPQFGLERDYTAFISPLGAKVVLITRKEITRISLSGNQKDGVNAGVVEETQWMPGDTVAVRDVKIDPAGSYDRIPLIERSYQIGVKWSGESEDKVMVDIAYSVDFTTDKFSDPNPETGIVDLNEYDQTLDLLYEATLSYPGFSEVIYRYSVTGHYKRKTYTIEFEPGTAFGQAGDIHVEMWGQSNYLQILQTELHMGANFEVVEKKQRQRDYRASGEQLLAFTGPDDDEDVSGQVNDSLGFADEPNHCLNTYVVHTVSLGGNMVLNLQPDPVDSFVGGLATTWPFFPRAFLWGVIGEYWPQGQDNTYGDRRIFPRGDATEGWATENHTWRDPDNPDQIVIEPLPSTQTIGCDANDPPVRWMDVQFYSEIGPNFAKYDDIIFYSDSDIKPKELKIAEADEATVFIDYKDSDSTETAQALHLLTGETVKPFFGLSAYSDEDLLFLYQSII